MKKTIRIVALTLCLALSAQVSTFAYDAGTACAVGTAGVATVMAAENAYETSVIARMAGRAGASTVKGAKGISFEIIYSDIQNAFHNVKHGLKTNLSASSIDDLADLVTTDKSGKVVKLIQCKDGTSPAQINKVLQQVSSGKYSSVELVGTKEFSALYSEKAAEKGIVQTVTDSKVSTATTEKVANKALGIPPSGSQLLKSTLKVSGISAAITGCVSLAESIFRGDDIYSTAGNVVVDASTSAASIALATVTAAEMPAILSALGISAVAANTTAAVVAFMVPVAGGYALYILADKYQFEEKIANGLENATEVIVYAFPEANNISSKIAFAWETVTTGASDLAATVTSCFNEPDEYITISPDFDSSSILIK